MSRLRIMEMEFWSFILLRGEVMKVSGFLLVFLSLLGFSTAQSPGIISNRTTCPMDLSYVLRIPFNSSTCKNFRAPPKTPQTDTTTIPCCRSLLSLFGIGLAQHLKATTLFLLPNIATSNSCLQSYQSKLTSLPLPSNLVSYCFDPSQFVTSPNFCAQIESSQDWVSKFNQTTDLDSACKPELTDHSSCDACVAAGFKIQAQLINLAGLPEKSNTKKSYIALATAIISATRVLLNILFSYLLWKRTLRNKRANSEIIRNFSAGDGNSDAELPVFSLRSILAATNFSQANKLGEGGYGPVYKGILIESQEVAIKRLSKKSGQGHQEFMNELKLIAKLQHTNLVRLLGCCIEEEEMILIYEYMPNRSLDKFLFGIWSSLLRFHSIDNMVDVFDELILFLVTSHSSSWFVQLDTSANTKLDWGKRFQIIEGIAQGVLYIHKHSRLKIIHRDLKASNVLLDGEMTPKISDFGVAKIFEINQTEANTNRVVGTYGYMSPEYARNGHAMAISLRNWMYLVLECCCWRL